MFKRRVYQRLIKFRLEHPTSTHFSKRNNDDKSNPHNPQSGDYKKLIMLIFIRHTAPTGVEQVTIIE
jgi:hypothetical protein